MISEGNNQYSTYMYVAYSTPAEKNWQTKNLLQSLLQEAIISPTRRVRGAVLFIFCGIFIFL